MTIHNISIPDVLSDLNPLELVQNLFMEIDKISTDSNARNPCSSTEDDGPKTLKAATPTRNAENAQFSWLTPSPQKQKSFSSPAYCSPATPNRATKDLKSSFSKRCVHVVMLDEIDALGAGGTSGAESSQCVIKETICSWMDDRAQKHIRKCIKGAPMPVVFIGTSNRPADVDAIFCRGGRLERVIDIFSSSVQDREEILKSLLKNALCNVLETSANKDDTCALLHGLARDIAQSTGGYVAADLRLLVSETVNEMLGSFRHDRMLSSSGDQLQEEIRSMVLDAAQRARKIVGPSCLRGATIALPNLTFDDIVGYPDVKRRLAKVLSYSNTKCREKLQKFGQSRSMGGVLLYGPPGNSKTRLVQAAAAVHGLPMIALSSADVYSAYVGDSEAEIRRVFRLARQSHPCVLFMDEMDALVTDRQDSSNGNNVESRVLSTILNEMDGIDGGSEGVFVIGATNRIDSIDSALLRKGRFQELLCVPSPSFDEKVEILNYFSKKYGITKLAEESLRQRLNNENMSGADVENLCREEGMVRIREAIANA